jgi:hypothetical protein
MAMFWGKKTIECVDIAKLLVLAIVQYGRMLVLTCLLYSLTLMLILLFYLPANVHIASICPNANTNISVFKTSMLT